MRLRIGESFGVGLGLLVVGGVVTAGEVSYPKVNVATAYVIDAKWPQRPAESRARASRVPGKLPKRRRPGDGRGAFTRESWSLSADRPPGAATSGTG